MTDFPADVIHIRPFRVIDCQGERRAPRPSRTMSALKGSVQLLNPGMDPHEIELLLKQDKYRRQNIHRETFKEWEEVTDRLCRVATDDPTPHMLIYIQNKQGKDAS